MCVGLLGRLPYLIEGSLGAGDADILEDRLAEQLNVLRDIGNAAADGCIAVLVQINAIHADGAALRLVILEQELGDGGLAGTRGTNQRHLFPLRDGEGDVVQCRGAVAIPEGDIFELNVALHALHLGVLSGIVLLGFIIHDLRQALHGDGSLLNGHLHTDELAHRRSKVARKGAERHVAAQRQLTIQHLRDAHIGGDHVQHGHDHAGDQALAGADLAGTQADLQALDVFTLKGFQLAILAGVALDGLDAAQALDHLAVQNGRLHHRLFIDPLVGLLEDDDEQQAQNGGKQSNGEQRGVHPEQDKACTHGHHNVHDHAHCNAGQHRFDGACIGIAGGDLAGLTGCKELHRQFVHMLEVAQHQRDIDFNGKEDQDPLSHSREQRAGQVDHTEHDNERYEQIFQPIGQHLVHDRLIKDGGHDADQCQDH